jgi:hypothetical protein
MADGLRIRSAPGTDAASTILGEPLTQGREVFVVAGPVPANGYLSWQARAVRRTDETFDLPFGWVAEAGRDGEIWLAPAAVACPTEPSIAALARLGGAGALVCYGRRDLQIRAFRREACGDGSTTMIGSPSWIAGAFGGHWLLEAERIDETVRGIYARAHPSLLNSGTPYFGCGQEGTGWFDVTGHFDDPVSSDCRTIVFDIPPAGGEREVEPALSITECRQTFVYTELRPAPGP